METVNSVTSSARIFNTFEHNKHGNEPNEFTLDHASRYTSRTTRRDHLWHEPRLLRVQQGDPFELSLRLGHLERLPNQDHWLLKHSAAKLH